MLKSRWLAPLLALFLIFTVVTNALAVTYLFQVEREVINVHVLKDGTAAIEYTIDFLNDRSADAIDFVDIGMPNGWYDLKSISAEIDGKPITHIAHSEYVTPGIELGLGSDAIPPGQRGQVHVAIGKVERFLYKADIEGKGEYASFNFVPNFFGSQYVRGSTDITVNLIMPEGMTQDQPVYYTPRNWPGDETPAASIDDLGRVVYTWTTQNGNAAAEYQFGGGIPASLVPSEALYEEYQQGPSSSGFDPSGWLLALVCGGGILGAVALIGGISSKAKLNRKQQYMPPKASIEGHGIKRGLTAVEAAILMQEPLDKVLTMILFGLLKKGTASVVTQNPLELKIEDQLPQDLRAYEEEFLKAYKVTDKRNRNKILQEMIVDLVQSVSQKIKGFSRAETIEYYKSITDKAWQYVMAADTPDVKMEKYDEAMDWTMLDENYDDKTRKMFGDDETVVVRPPNWWWRYDPTFRPTGSYGTPSASGPSTSTAHMPSHTSSAPSAPTLPGANLAADMVNSVQNVSASIVGGLSSFTGGVTNQTNPLPPPPRYTSSGRSGGGGHSCACACACAGCACACAGGGR